MSVEGRAVRKSKDTAPAEQSGSPGDRLVLLHAVWLSADVILIVLAAHQPVTGAVAASAECGEVTAQVAARAITFQRAASLAATATTAQAVLLRLPVGHFDKNLVTFVLDVDGSSLRLPSSNIGQANASLDALLRQELAALSAEERARFLSFLALGPGEARYPPKGGPGKEPRSEPETTSSSFMLGLQYSKSLHTVRQALRERLPSGLISPDVPQGLNIDAILAIDDRCFYFQGWMHSELSPASRLTAVSPEGVRVDILPGLFRYSRPDVEQFYGQSPHDEEINQGWIRHVELPVPSRLSKGWIFEMANSAGSELEVPGPEVTYDLSTIRDLLLQDLYREQLPAEELRAQHIAPAMTRLEKRRRSQATIETMDQHGTAPIDPEVSVIVPLYGRIDFLEHQLAQFIHDPEFRVVDLIYVLDSPDLADAFRLRAGQLAELYEVPFRAVVMSHNIGFSGVNNIGAELARGRLLLLLNSDVLPREAGWLSAMTAFYDTTPSIGALAPKLLYEDDSIQHAGLYFRRLVRSGLWNNEHYYKGLHRTVPAANLTRVVPALTAACMLIDKTLYQKLGGLRGTYVQGDYEDSDLCLRLSSEEERQNWYLPSVELYHLEGQSYPSPIRQLTGDYNRWLHSHIWTERIAELMEESW